MVIQTWASLNTSIEKVLQLDMVRQCNVLLAFNGFAKIWALDRHFEAEMSQAAADDRYAGWRDAVSRVLSDRGDRK